jgi:hypothetical protein
MKTFLTILAVAFTLASCSRSGTTIANDDSAVNSQLQSSENKLRLPEEYPVTEKELPAEVRIDFYNRYPGANNTQWYLLADGTYKAVFFQGKIKWTAIYAADGTLIHEEHL